MPRSRSRRLISEAISGQDGPNRVEVPGVADDRWTRQRPTTGEVASTHSPESEIIARLPMERLGGRPLAPDES